MQDCSQRKKAITSAPPRQNADGKSTPCYPYPQHALVSTIAPSPRSRSCRAPWTAPSPAIAGSATPPATSVAPDEALAVLWRDDSFAGPNGEIGREAGTFRILGGNNGGARSSHTRGGGGVGLIGGAAGAGTAASGDGSAGDGRSGPAAKRRGRAQCATVVAILREDARVPPGHIAEAAPAAGGGGARLRDRAGLALLRRSARVRVLSAAESPVASPR